MKFQIIDSHYEDDTVILFGKNENMRKKINLEDIENGFKLYLENVKTTNKEEIDKNIINSLYS